jgi:hypothetical protein
VLQVHRQLVLVRQKNIHLYALLDALVTGVMLFATDCQIRYVSQPAERLLCEHDVLEVLHDNIAAAIFLTGPDQGHHLSDRLLKDITT